MVKPAGGKYLPDMGYRFGLVLLEVCKACHNELYSIAGALVATPDRFPIVVL